jgi:hypothetical protein
MRRRKSAVGKGPAYLKLWIHGLQQMESPFNLLLPVTERSAVAAMAEGGWL